MKPKFAILLGLLSVSLGLVLALNHDSITINVESQLAISIALKYGDNDWFDPNNDGIEAKLGVIDFSITGTHFNFSPDENYLCTRWQVRSLENQTTQTICYGNELCCNFLGLQATPQRLWNQDFFLYESYLGATGNNELSAQIIYYNVSVDPEQPYAVVHNSAWATLPAVFKQESTHLATTVRDLLINAISAVRGAIVTIKAKLVYENQSPVPYQKVDVFAGNELIGIAGTDITGLVVFNWNTSQSIPGNYLLNVTFAGQETVGNQQTLSLLPSFNTSEVEITEGGPLSLDLSQAEATKGNYYFISRDTAWSIIKKDYLDEYLDFSFVYVNDTHYRVDWGWNDEFVRDILRNCVPLNGQKQKDCQNNATLYHIQKGSGKLRLKGWVNDEFQEELRKKCFEKRQKSDFENCKNRVSSSLYNKRTFTIESFSLPYLEKDSVTLRNDVAKIKQEGMPHIVLNGKGKFVGDLNPINHDNGSFFIELTDGFYESNGLNIKWGLNSTLAEFNNSKMIENLTFVEYQNISRYLKLHKNATISSATLTLRGFESDFRPIQPVPFGHYGLSRANNGSSRFLSQHGGGDNLNLNNQTNFGNRVCITSLQGDVVDQNVQGLAVTDDNNLWTLTDPPGNVKYRNVHKCTGTLNCLDSNATCGSSWSECLNYTCTNIFDVPNADVGGNDTQMTGLAMRGDEFVYLIAFENESILKYNASGNLISNIKLNFRPSSLEFDGNNFLVGVYQQPTLAKFTGDGTNIRNYTLPSIVCSAGNSQYFLRGSYVRDKFNFDYLYAGVYDGGLSACQFEFPRYPENLTVDTNNDGALDYANLSLFNGTMASVSLNVTALQNCLSTCSSPSEDYCICEVNFTSAKSGKLEYSNINIVYNILPTFSLQTFDDSNETNTTKKGSPVNFSASIQDTDTSDTIRLLICDPSGRTGSQCVQTEYCKSNFQAPGQVSCRYNTTNLTGVSYNWTSFACDNNSACANGVNGTFFISRPRNPAFFVNGTEFWNYSGLFDGPITVEGFSDEINNSLANCNFVNDSCNVSFIFSSDAPGVLEVSLIDIQYLAYDTEPPTINNISAVPNPAPRNSNINITVIATDNGNVTRVVASLLDKEANLTYDGSTGQFTGSILTPPSPGNYPLNITAYDSANLSTTSSNISTTQSGGSGVGVQSGNQSSPPNEELTLTTSDISFSPLNPNENDSVFINATILNFGNANASTFSVQLKVDGLVNATNALSVQELSSNLTQFNWTAMAGNHIFTIVADSGSVISEDNESNNEASKNISVQDLTPPSVLGIVTERGSLIIKLNISDNLNISNVTAWVNGTIFQFNFNISSALWEGFSSQVGPGTYPITIKVIDLYGLTTTVQSTITVYGSLIDLSLATGDMHISPLSPLESEQVNVSVNIYNRGVNASTNFSVEFLVDNSSKGTKTISVPGDSNTTTSFQWNATFSNHTLTGRIDSLDSISELNETNNEISKQINVKDGRLPTINKVMLPQILYAGSLFSVKVNATDNVNISNVKVTLNGTTTTLLHNTSTGLYENTSLSPSAGAYTLLVAATDTSALVSSTERLVTVYGSSADLLVDTGGLQFVPSNITDQQSVSINATVKNWGGSDANNFKVELLRNGQSLQNTTISVARAETTVASFTLTSGYGSQNFTIKLDADNGIGESNESNNIYERTVFVYDSTPPAIISGLSANPSGWTTQTTGTVSWNIVTDANGIDRYDYRFDNQDWKTNSLNTSMTFNNLSDGIHNVSVRAIDVPGNIGNISNVSLFIDTIQPNTPIIKAWEAEKNWTNQNTTLITWEDPGDSGSGIVNFSVSVDSGGETLIGNNLSYRTGILASGTHTLKVRAYDAVNQSSNFSNMITVYIDTSAPGNGTITSSTHPSSNNWYAIKNPVFNWTSPADNSGILGFHYLFDQTSNTTPDSLSLFSTNNSINLTDTGKGVTGATNQTNATNETGLPDGIWYFHLVPKDNAGLLANNVSHFAFKIDSTAPSVFNISPGNNTNSQNTTPLIKVEYRDTASGVNVSAVALFLDGEDITVGSTINATLASYTPSNPLNSGSHSGKISLTDTNRNTANYIWTFDLEGSNVDVQNLTELYVSNSFRIFGFIVKNTGQTSIINTNWSLNTGSTTFYGNSSFNLTVGENRSIVADFNYTQTGEYTVTAFATNGSNNGSASINVIIPDVEVMNLTVLNASATERAFEFVLRNYLDIPLTNVSWTINFGDNISNTALTDLSLAALENTSTIINHNYSAGTYLVNASALNGSLFGYLNKTFTVI
ncbi:hypothetical protein HYV84_05650 [Candidatus Woesearchaeota archaeon]|nr:hypothetical protein [Candidatus Woesearchaeota archaeon]